MKKYWPLLIIIPIILFIFVGLPLLFINQEQARHTVISRQSIGKITSAEVIPTSWNEAIKMQIVTEKYVIILRGLTPPVPIGEEAELLQTQTGRQAISWESTNKMWAITTGAR